MSFGASAQAVAHIRSYAEAEAFLAAKGVDSRKVCGDNTYVERRGDDIAIRLHQTDIITFLKAASPLIVLNTDGWHTLITRQRLEQFLPAPLTLYAFKGQWRIGLKDGQRWATTKEENTHSVVFTDGLKLIWNTVGWEPLNALTSDAEEKLNAAKRDLDKAVKAYCKKLDAKLPVWAQEIKENQSLNVAGDPWCCTMGVGAEGNGHLWTHLKDGYVFPTIVVRAFEDSGRWDGGGLTAADRAVTHLAYGFSREITREVAKYLRKKLNPFTSPEAAAADPKSNAALERYVDHAKDVLTKPSDFGYFGRDETLWVSSAPTFARTRDSENLDIANFEIVWETLAAEFPDLVTATDDDSRWDQNPGGIYIFGAGHWAVGHIDQIVVPVLKDPARPLGPTNLHPAFLRVCEFAEQTKLYPALPGAEERASEMDRDQIAKDVNSSLDWLISKGETQLESYRDEIVGYWVQREDEYDWSSDSVYLAHIDLVWDEAHAPLPGQGVLL